MQYAFAFGLQQHGEIWGKIWGNSLKSKLWVRMLCHLSASCSCSWKWLESLQTEHCVKKSHLLIHLLACLAHCCVQCVFFLKIGGRCTVLKVCSFLPSAQSFIPGLFCCFPPEERGTSKVLCKVSNPWSYFAQLLSSSFPVFSADVGSKWDYSWLKVS